MPASVPAPLKSLHFGVCVFKREHQAPGPAECVLVVCFLLFLRISQAKKYIPWLAAPDAGMSWLALDPTEVGVHPKYTAGSLLDDGEHSNSETATST